jgi:EmrB/QacA subfamily drug resistance transporter
MSSHAAPNPTPAPEESLLDPRHRWLVMCAVGVGSLLGSIDNSVVNIALPTIRHQFGAEVALAEWVIAIYLLAACGLLLTFGRLGDMIGQKPIYVWGFFLFVVSSALSGLAPGILFLIVCRGLQGVGASMLFSSSPAILTMNFPGSQRGRVLGLQVVMVYLGSTVGPMLGGWLTDSFSWRSVFYINVPIGLAALVLSAKFIPRSRPAQTGERFDFAGALLFMAAFSFLLTALNKGHQYGWLSAPIAAMFAAAILLLALFVLVERRIASPLLDLGLFRSAPFSLSSFSSICNYLGLFVLGFLMPFYLIQGLNLTSSHAGLLMTAQPLMMVIFAPIFGALSDKIGTRLPAMTGMALQATALLMLSQVGPATSERYIAAAMALMGLGVGMFVAPNNSTLMGSAPRHRQGIASAVLATARYIGMILGVGLSGAIFTTFLHFGAQTGFYTGIRLSFLVGGFVSITGGVASWVRKTS